MTPAERKIYEALVRWMAGHPDPPNAGELARWLNTHRGNTKRLLTSLLDQGYVVEVSAGARRRYRTVPQELAGFVRCDNGHEPLFFERRPCPACHIREELRPSRVIS